MQEWKQACSLAKLELKASGLALLFAFIFVLLIISSLVSSLDSYLGNGYVGYDFFFVLVFSIAAIWTKPKDFQIQKINGNFSASPLLVMQKQLPIKQEVIIKSRFIVHFFYSFPFQVLTLFAVYLFSPLQGMLSIGSFIAFSIMWLSFGIYAGYMFPMTDAGEKGPFSETTAAVIFGVVLLIIIFIIFSFIHILFDNGIVYWSIILVQKWPILSTAVSIVLAFAGFKHWQYYMRKRMNRFDYL